MTGVCITAAGHGQVNEERPKLLEDLGDGRFVLQAVVENVKAAGDFSPIVVVLNGRFGAEIQLALEKAGHRGLEYVHQTSRHGAADAFYRTLPVFRDYCASDALVVFGDMPRLKPDLMREMVQVHTAEAHKISRPDLTISSWPYESNHPLAEFMANYTFVIHDHDVEHQSTPLLFLYSGHTPVEGSDVLSSLYVMRLEWFEKMFPLMHALDKGDGFGPEKHMPKLVELAALHGGKICNLRRSDIADQIIGINTASDLQLVQQLFACETL